MVKDAFEIDMSIMPISVPFEAGLEYPNNSCKYV